jgi:hypothetical protein
MELNTTGLSMMDASIPLVGIAYTAGKYTPVRKCKGLYSTADKTVVVHLIRDDAALSIPVALTAGVPFGCAFDWIVEAGTTADLTGVYALPM